MTKEIYLIDGSAFIYRAFHAVAPLTNSSGFQTNAVFGFVNMLRRLLNEREPEFIAVAFDSRGPVFRHEMYEPYKANRPSMPEELAGQIPYIKEAVRALGIKSFEKEGIEADDIIGSAARQLSANGYEVIIVSGDKDLLQLVDDRVRMWDPMNDRLMDRQAIKEKYQVSPKQLLDCFALTGDSSDNVPGVPGIGPKTSAKLINEYGSLDNLYEQVDLLKKSKMKQNLIDHREQAFLSRELIRLKLDADVPVEPGGYHVGETDNERLKALYSELGFSRLLKEITRADRIPTEGFTLVSDDGALASLQDHLGSAQVLAVDTETTSLESRTAGVVGISLSTTLDECWYIPLSHLDESGAPVSQQLSASAVKKVLKPFLQSKTLAKIGHNLKFDYAVFKHGFDIELAGPLIDTMVAAHLVEPARRSFKLDDLCLDLDLKLTSFETIVAGDKREEAFAYVDIDKACLYSCEDVYGTLALWQHYQPQLEEKDMVSLFGDVEMPLVPVLSDMECAGIRVDPARLDLLAADFRRKIEVLENRIYEMAGRSFNINSPQQLGTILFEELGLPHGRKTKTGYSTDAKVLEKLAATHEVPALIIEYRTLAKLLSTYVDKLKSLIAPDTERIHTSFNQTVTTTGRLSSSNPNLQNIPIKGEEGSRIREAFVPDPGKIFLCADYSQIDLRVLAHYSQDPALLKAFRQGDDIHTRTAAEVFGVSPLFVTPEMRRVAKSINFGIVYGMSSFGLSNQLRISRSEAAKFIERYFTLYGGVKQFMKDIVEQARSDGYVSTILNRRRYLPEIASSNKARREFAERAAINTPIQGTAADIIKLAMLKVDTLLKKSGNSCLMLLQIHDELVFELSPEDCQTVRDPLRRAMEKALALDVPLVVNMQTGQSLAK